jgi:hypothetical protein
MSASVYAALPKAPGPVDLPSPQCNLSAVEPIGAHLALQMSDERVLELSDQLTCIVGEYVPGSND